MRAWTALFAARSNCPDPSFAGTTVPGHFAQTGPVLGRLVRVGPAPVEPLHGDLARAGPLSAHFARAGPVGVFSGAGPVVGHLAEPVLGHLERVVRI